MSKKGRDRNKFEVFLDGVDEMNEVFFRGVLFGCLLFFLYYAEF